MYQPTNNSVAPSMMQLKEKCMNLTSLKNIQLPDGWGWFIDIESNNNNILLTQINRQTSKPVLIPQSFKEELLKEKPFNEKTFNEETFKEETVKEDTFEEETVSRPFKSNKSMGKLHDDSMIFEMDVEVHDKKKEKSKKIFRILKSLFIVGVICIFYGFILL
jgi:hypothetical protein